ncbi:MAG: hypothetical protein Q7T20_14655 [Saprospiraceae bacterium]|nr:hypothetical protein [Saprospiraceae bacterium]
MKNLVSLMLCLPLMGFGQAPKSIHPLTASMEEKTAVTRSVVIGISDYQHNAIPDLKFANRDAQAFAEWLTSPSGGEVPTDSVMVLLNGKVTAGLVIITG